MTLSDRYVAQAQERAGLDNWHNQTFRTALEVLIEGFDASPNVSPAGRVKLDEMVIADLIRRLQVDDYLARRPELVERPVVAPLFVGGMPRTGTTLLINLLAQDTRRRTPLKWEVDYPVPPATSETLRTDPRAMAMMQADHELVASGTSRVDIHFEWAIEPRECVYIMAQNFVAMSYEAFCPSPKYTEYLFGCDQTSTYQVHKRMLQVLQSEAPGMWTCKAPSHILWTKEILDVYPDAHIVWTHRDPAVAVPSLCSLITRSQGEYCDPVTHAWLSGHLPDYMFQHTVKPLETMRTHPGRIHHVRYADMVIDPIGTLRRLYNELGTEFTFETEAAVTGWLLEHPMGKFGRHSYGPEKFGLDAEVLRAQFKEYMDTFEVPREDG